MPFFPGRTIKILLRQSQTTLWPILFNQSGRVKMNSGNIEAVAGGNDTMPGDLTAIE
jgi:hypothetical protein